MTGKNPFKDSQKEKLSAKYSDSTVRNMCYVAKLCNKCCGCKKLSLRRCKHNFEAILEAIQEKSLNTEDTYLRLLTLMCDVLEYKQWSSLRKAVKNVKKRVKESVSTQKNELLQDLDLDDVIDFADSQPLKTMHDEQRRVMVYVLNELPLRLSELASIRIDHYDQASGNENYLDYGSNTIVLRSHKTSSRCGTRVHKLSQGVVSRIQQSFNVFTRKYLLQGKNGTPMTANSASMFLVRLLKAYGKKRHINVTGMGIHTIRHNHATKALRKLDLDVETVKALMKIQSVMGHASMQTTFDHYVKTFAD